MFGDTHRLCRVRKCRARAERIVLDQDTKRTLYYCEEHWIRYDATRHKRDGEPCKTSTPTNTRA
jgi:hypothetical protein